MIAPRAIRRAIGFVAVAPFAAPAAFAKDDLGSLERGLSHVDWSQHPGAAIAAIAGMVLAAVVVAAGVGAAVALFGAMVPRWRDAVDAATRAASAGWILVTGSAGLGGVLFALTAAGRVDAAWVQTTVMIVLGIPTILLALAGSLGAIPLLGERLLGAGGISASPLRRSVTATLAIFGALLPGLALDAGPLSLLVALVGLAWPLGSGIQTLRRAFARRV